MIGMSASNKTSTTIRGIFFTMKRPRFPIRVDNTISLSPWEDNVNRADAYLTIGGYV
jgi:hypothetical protein